MERPTHMKTEQANNGLYPCVDSDDDDKASDICCNAKHIINYRQAQTIS
jgi:hypothetical protein